MTLWMSLLHLLLFHHLLVDCHAAGGPRRKWSGRTKHGATNGPPGPCTAATVGPPIEHGLSIRNTVMTVVLYQYGLI